MATLGAPQDISVLKMKAYTFILKFTMFQIPTVYRFSTAERTTWLWVDSTAPLCLLELRLIVKYEQRSF